MVFMPRICDGSTCWGFASDLQVVGGMGAAICLQWDNSLLRNGGRYLSCTLFRRKIGMEASADFLIIKVWVIQPLFRLTDHSF